MILRSLASLESPHQFAGWLPRVGREEEDIFCGYLELACAAVTASAYSVDNPLVGDIRWMDHFLATALETPDFAACLLTQWKESHVTTATRRASSTEQIALF